jgi:glutamate synthase (NADPH) small chain
MGNPKAFLTIERKEAGYRPVHERKTDFGEVEQTLNNEDRMLQASRCMDCGVPFCHWACPLGNKMPEYNDLLYKGKWKQAYEVLAETDDFPEFTGRICPALCEKSCVLNIDHHAVTIREDEAAVTERAWSEGWIVPAPPKSRTGKKVAVIGSGPAGLVAAFRLNRQGHEVTVYEKNPHIGGLLRFGIPDFKLNKNVIDRRLEMMEAEGVKFVTNAEVGRTLSIKDLQKQYDALCITIGAGKPRDLVAEGREINGIHFALDFLFQQNYKIAGLPVDVPEIDAKGKRVLVIGGGDTGSDCVGTSIRQGATEVNQIEIMPMPPAGDNPATPWPNWPNVLKTSSSHEEGCNRRWCLTTHKFIGKAGKLTGVEVAEVEWFTDPATGRFTMKETGKTEVIKTDLVFLAMGFTNPVHEGLLDELGVTYDARGNVAVNAQNESSLKSVFAAGDAASGASLVVRAMASGRQTAEAINQYLKGIR